MYQNPFRSSECFSEKLILFFQMSDVSYRYLPVCGFNQFPDFIFCESTAHFNAGDALIFQFHSNTNRIINVPDADDGSLSVMNVSNVFQAMELRAFYQECKSFHRFLTSSSPNAFVPRHLAPLLSSRRL